MSDSMDNVEDGFITLTLDNDEKVECSVLAIYETAGKSYIALLPLDENGEEKLDSDVYLYRYHEENGEPVLENIEDDDEFDAASDGFDEWMDTMEFEEMEEDDESDDLDDLIDLDGYPDNMED